MLSLMLTALNSRWISDAVGTHAQAGGLGQPADLQTRRAARLDPRALSDLLAAAQSQGRTAPDHPRRDRGRAGAGGARSTSTSLVWPFLQKKLDHEYSVFQHSVTILLWAFAVAMIVLAGAHWTARQDRPDPLS